MLQTKGWAQIYRDESTIVLCKGKALSLIPPMSLCPACEFFRGMLVNSGISALHQNNTVADNNKSEDIYNKATAYMGVEGRYI
jgi:hypothetical protein